MTTDKKFLPRRLAELADRLLKLTDRISTDVNTQDWDNVERIRGLGDDENPLTFREAADTLLRLCDIALVSANRKAKRTIRAIQRDTLYACTTGGMAEVAIDAGFSWLPEIVADLPENEQKDDCLDSLQNLKLKYEDPEFRLAVIGNFSCGKSTFLNAVVGRELLAVSDLPTTAIPTYIRWNREAVKNQLKELMEQEQSKRGFFSRMFHRLFGGRQAVPEPEMPEDPYIIVTVQGGARYALHGTQRERFERDTGVILPQDIGGLIDYLTTTNDLAEKVLRIDLSFPSQDRYRNFCLIDTPGVNPGDEDSKNHILQTQSVLREEADAAIILYPATSVMTKDLELFMEENAAHLLGNAIILITKMDIVTREREQEKLLSYTKKLVQERFGQADPEVYGISAGQALEYRCGESDDPEKAQQWSESFDRDLEQIFSSLRSRRETIVSERIAGLLAETIEMIEDVIHQDTQRLVKERENLQQHSLEHLSRDFEVLRDRYIADMNRKSEARRAEAWNVAMSCVRERRDRICARMQAQTNGGDLKRCMETAPSEILAGVDEEIMDIIRQNIAGPMAAESQAYAKEVERCLEEYQRCVGGVSGQRVYLDQNDLSSANSIYVPDSPSFMGNNAGKLLLGGGAFLLAPMFALPALAIGWLIDIFRFDARKAEAIQKMTDSLDDYGRNLASQCEEQIAGIELENQAWAENVFQAYQTQYSTFFERVEREFREQERRINDDISRNKENVNRLKCLHGGLKEETYGEE